MLLSEKLIEESKGTFFFVKFIPKQYLDKFKEGFIRMNNLKTYVDMEKESKIKGIGDKYEGALVLKKIQFKMYDPETDELKHEFDVDEVSLNHEEDMLHPVFCAYVIDTDNLEIIEETENEATTKINISDDELEKMIKEFGDSVVLIKAKEFTDRFIRACKENEYSYDAGKVKYYDYSINQKERVTTFFEDPLMKKAFMKDDYFKHQNEFRLILTNHTINEPMDFYLGDISDIVYETDARSIFKGMAMKFDKVHQ